MSRGSTAKKPALPYAECKRRELLGPWRDRCGTAYVAAWLDGAWGLFRGPDPPRPGQSPHQSCPHEFTRLLSFAAFTRPDP